MLAADSENDNKIVKRLDIASDANWEATTYPTANAELHAWMREQRGLIRAFLASNFGAVGAASNKNAAADRANAERSVIA